MSRKFHRRMAASRSLRAIALYEIAVARRAVGNAAGREAEAIHEVRRRLKRLRALIRLPGRHFPAFRRENRAFRDLGRDLAGAREAEVLAASFDATAGRAGIEASPELRDRVVAAGVHAGASGRLSKVLVEAVEPGLAAAAERARHWHFDTRGFALVGPGARRTYRRMRRAGRAARLATTAVTLHEWRKRVKYHAAQLDLLSVVAPNVLAGRVELADRLADILGEHHDLDQLRTAIAACAAVPEEDGRRLEAAIASRAAELEVEAFRLGDALGAESPKAFRRRLVSRWHAWRRR